MAKIAVDLQRAVARRAIHGGPGHPAARVLAKGEGWRVADVICASGPQDRPYEERHVHVSIAMVLAGTFQYRSQSHYRSPACELMTPGSLLLGNPGQYFECGHEHGAGDRCISFLYSPEYFERIAFEAGAGCSRSAAKFSVLRLPPMRALAPLVARASSSLIATGNNNSGEFDWEELGLQLAAQAFQAAGGISSGTVSPPPNAVAQVTRTVRAIDRRPHARHTLAALATEARLSPYHFLRVFENVTGVTPHQYILRARLREAAIRLAAGQTKILDIALDCGFGDVSNFNRAFRTEFGANPRLFRTRNSRVSALRFDPIQHSSLSVK